MQKTMLGRWTGVLLVLVHLWTSPLVVVAQSDDFGLSETEVDILTGFGDLTQFIPQFELLETAVAVLQGDIGALTNLLDVEFLADLAGYGLAADALQAGMDAVGLDQEFLENFVLPEITNAINDVLGDIGGLNEAIEAVESTLENVDFVIDGLEAAISAVESAISAVQALVDATTGWMNDVLDGVGGYINDAGEWVDGAIDDVGDFVDGGCFGIFCLILTDIGEPWAFEPAVVDVNPDTPPVGPVHPGPMNAIQPAASNGIGVGYTTTNLLALAPSGQGATQALPDAGTQPTMLDFAAYPSVEADMALSGATLLHPVIHGDVGGLAPSDVGLDAVENTADLAKPISTPLSTALEEKVEWTHVPATPFAPCEVGEWAHDDIHLYMCSAPNTWTRTALADW